MLFGLGSIIQIFPQVGNDETLPLNPEPALQQAALAALANDALATQPLPIRAPIDLSHLDGALEGVISRTVEISIYFTLCTIFKINPDLNQGYAGLIRNRTFEEGLNLFLKENLSKPLYLFAVPLAFVLDKMFQLIMGSIFSQVLDFSKKEIEGLLSDNPEKRILLLQFLSQKVRSFINIHHARNLQDETLTRTLRDEHGIESEDIRSMSDISTDFYKSLSHILIEAFFPKINLGIEASINNAINSLYAMRESASTDNVFILILKEVFLVQLLFLLEKTNDYIIKPCGKLSDLLMKSISHKFSGIVEAIVISSLSSLPNQLEANRGYQLEIQTALNDLFGATDAGTIEDARSHQEPLTSVSDEEKTLLRGIQNNILGLFTGMQVPSGLLGSASRYAIDSALSTDKLGNFLNPQIVEKYRQNFNSDTLGKLASLSIVKLKESLENLGMPNPTVLSDEEYTTQLEAKETEFSANLQDLLDNFYRTTVATASPDESYKFKIGRLFGRAYHGTTNMFLNLAYGTTIEGATSHYAGYKLKGLKQVFLDDEAITAVVQSSAKNFARHLRQVT